MKKTAKNSTGIKRPYKPARISSELFVSDPLLRLSKTLNLQPTTYQELQVGDRVAHILMEGSSKLWSGVVTEKNPITDECYGTERVAAEWSEAHQAWGVSGKNSDETGVLLAADWHDAPALGHTLYKVMTAEVEATIAA